MSGAVSNPSLQSNFLIDLIRRYNGNHELIRNHVNRIIMIYMRSVKMHANADVQAKEIIHLYKDMMRAWPILETMPSVHIAVDNKCEEIIADFDSHPWPSYTQLRMLEVLKHWKACFPLNENLRTLWWFDPGRYTRVINIGVPGDENLSAPG